MYKTYFVFWCVRCILGYLSLTRKHFAPFIFHIQADTIHGRHNTSFTVHSCTLHRNIYILEGFFVINYSNYFRFLFIKFKFLYFCRYGKYSDRVKTATWLIFIMVVSHFFYAAVLYVFYYCATSINVLLVQVN